MAVGLRTARTWAMFRREERGCLERVFSRHGGFKSKHRTISWKPRLNGSTFHGHASDASPHVIPAVYRQFIAVLLAVSGTFVTYSSVINVQIFAWMLASYFRQLFFSISWVEGFQEVY